MPNIPSPIDERKGLIRRKASKIGNARSQAKVDASQWGRWNLSEATMWSVSAGQYFSKLGEDVKRFSRLAFQRVRWGMFSCHAPQVYRFVPPDAKAIRLTVVGS